MIRLNIVTPERPFLKEDCASVTLPGQEGEMQVLPGHAALLAELRPGLLSYQRTDKAIVNFMISEGFVEVDHDEVNVLCEQARHKAEIDKDFEEELARELKDQIKRHEEADAEQKRLFAELARCTARLKLFE